MLRSGGETPSARSQIRGTISVARERRDQAPEEHVYATNRPPAGWFWLMFAGLALLWMPVNRVQAAATTTTTNVSVPVNFTASNCAGELVAFTGELHQVIHVTQDSSGGRHTHVHNNFQGVQ